MNKKSSVHTAALLTALCWCGADGLQAQLYYVYQGNVLQGSITAYTGSTTAAANYSYSSSKAHLQQGPTLTSGKAHLFLFSGTDGLHFNAVFNDAKAGGAGTANWSMALTGNGGTATVQVADDGAELSGSGSAFTGGWGWSANYTDGGVIGALSGSSWELTITPTSQSISGIAAYSGSGSSISLSTGTGSGNAIKITPIPEPWEAASCSALGLLGLAGWRRWRRRRN